MSDQPPLWESVNEEWRLSAPWGLYRVLSQDGGYHAHFFPHPDHREMLPQCERRYLSHEKAIEVCDDHFRAVGVLMEKIREKPLEEGGQGAPVPGTPNPAF